MADTPAGNNGPINGAAIPAFDPASFSPTGNNSAGPVVADPDSGTAVAGAVPPTGPKPKRGRPPGSKNKGNLSVTAQPVKTAPLSVDSVSAILLSVHGMLAGITRVRELALDPKEAKQLAEAVAEVGKHYDLTADPKTIAWVNLAMTCGAVYGSRFVAIQFRIKSQREHDAKKVKAETQPDFLHGQLPPMDGGHNPPMH